MTTARAGRQWPAPPHHTNRPAAMTAYRIAAKSPAEIRRETYVEKVARIAAAHEEAKRIGCPHGEQFYRCESCGNEWAEHESYPADRKCDLCDETVEAQDNPLRKAWFAGFARAQELAE